GVPCTRIICRGLNTVTVPDRYTMPNMQSLNDHMEGCLVKAYHQIPIAEEDIPKIVIATPFGKKKHRSGPPASPYGP
ncbi:MAG: hypothetical protein ACK56F_00115, partial [bacterium]